MYVDDLGLACAAHMSVLTRVQDDLAALLGMVFKKAKDVLGVRDMKFIGFNISIRNSEVIVSVPSEFQVATATSIRALLDNPTPTIGDL